MTSNLKLNHFLRFSKISKFFDLENEYGERFLSSPLFPRVAEVAEYINLILFSKQNLKTSLVPIEFDLKQSPNFIKLW